MRLLQTSHSTPAAAGPVLDLPEAGEFSIVFLPDTQFYSAHSPDVFLGQTRWIADNRARLNIQAVLHEGDSVDGNLAEQWANAEAAIDILDAAEIPYLIAIGNHDYDTFSDAERRTTAFNAAFPPERYTAHAWWRGGFYEAGHTENAYCLLTIEGAEYLLLNLEFGPRQAVIDWAHDILARYPDRWAVLVTHSYLYIDGTRVGPGDKHNPKIYPLGASANDGEDLWAKLVSLHDNLHWVQSGHHIGGHAAHRKDEGRGGTAVAQVFANWQDAANGGDGWLRLVTFGSGRARVQTFSPALGVVNAEAENKFVITL
ncbi:MAG: metallophosphoesterase [Anaerolineales bacterium]